MVKFGERTYRIPAGAVIAQLREAGYEIPPSITENKRRRAMPYVFAVILLIIVLLFGLSSMSESYAVAKQAEAVVAANHTAQLASATNVVLVLVIALLVVGILGLQGVILYLKMREPDAAPRQGTHKWVAGPNAKWQVAEPAQPRTPLETLTELLVLQMLQNMQPTQTSALPYAAQSIQPDDEDFAWPME